jgi:glycosyltransferase involved in cell wall biosynthesis
MGRLLTVAWISTWSPRRCGIATFSTDLTRAVQRADAGIVVRAAAIDSASTAYRYGPEVRWRARQGRPESFRRLAGDLSRADVDLVSLQHEFGLYGAWGEQFEDHIAPFLAELDRPLVSTLHTVLPNPSPSVRTAVRRLVTHSRAVIVMTDLARRLLIETYGADGMKVHVVKHGAPAVERCGQRALKDRLGLDQRFVISTFGLLDQRKGIDVMVRAMRSVVRRQPNALYLIIGVTHPEVVARQHETYRDELRGLVGRYGLQDSVRFVDRFLTQREIVEYLLASDVYVTPYLDPNQVSSGTLAYALGTGKAVVSTRYAHAVEALDDGRGILVDFNDATQLAESVIALAESPDRRRELELRAFQYGRTTFWPLIGARMAALYHAVTECCANWAD